MKRAIVGLAVATVVLGAWERWLAAAAAREREDRSRVGRLLSAEERESVAGGAPLRIEIPGEGRFTYAPSKGRWRCLEHHGAPADGEAVVRLAKSLAEAAGIVHTAEVALAPEYGINAPDTARVTLLDPTDGRERFAFDIGSSIPGRDACFVRRRGSKEIWAIDGDPRAALERRAAPGLPPLLEAGIVPAAWPASRAAVARVSLERADGARIELERRALEPDPERMRAGELPWTWILDPGPDEREANGATAEAFVGFLRRAPYVEVLDRERRPERPRATLTLRSTDGEALRVEVGEPLPGGGALVWIPESEVLYRVAPDAVPRLLPDAAQLLAELDASPWGSGGSR